MKYTTVLFDLDGTLTRSEEGITKTAIYAAEKMGFTGYTPEQFKVFIGPPLFDSFRKVVGMTDEQAIQAIDYYHERFERLGWAENEVYAGIPSLLRSLKKNGVRVAIVTAKPQIFAELRLFAGALKPLAATWSWWATAALTSTVAKPTVWTPSASATATAAKRN